ncbi:DMP19 family protein [Pseudarthrobacter sp. J1763]|uniref:DMP19 family protein n=1 Tax=Pseudarthrobacter sp. J1763 TaxID=3420445 RepID=UPI003D2CEFE4
MTSNQLPVVLTEASLAAGNEEVVDGNVTVVNAMYQEFLGEDEIAQNALRSYYVDFYLSQALGGGFAQYVFTSGDRDGVDEYVREGLEEMGAAKHLELFNRSSETFDDLSEEDAEAYLDGDAEDEDGEPNEAVQKMESLDDEFESTLEEEDIIALNAAWLKGQEGLVVLPEAELEAHIAERVSKVADIEDRRAEAAEEALADAPDFEIIIRELCDVAGYELIKINSGDPNYEHDGGTVLAWHFTTDHGDFVMIEEEDEAFMINPENQEIIAAVEFEEDDEDYDFEDFDDDSADSAEAHESVKA